MLTSCLRASHWLAHTAFYALVLQYSSVRVIQLVRCCSAVLTVESITIYIQRCYLYYQMSSPRKLGNDEAIGTASRGSFAVAELLIVNVVKT